MYYVSVARIHMDVMDDSHGESSQVWSVSSVKSGQQVTFPAVLLGPITPTILIFKERLTPAL